MDPEHAAHLNASEATIGRAGVSRRPNRKNRTRGHRKAPRYRARFSDEAAEREQVRLAAHARARRRAAAVGR